MKPIEANFLIIKVEEDVWDVAIFSEIAVLKAFNKVYHGHYIHKSVFDEKPMCVIPEFPNKRHAQIWKHYWIKAFSDPDNACESCQTVNELFHSIENFRKSGKE